MYPSPEEDEENLEELAEPAGELTCARCGMAKEEWTAQAGEGILEEGEFYCCEGCVANTGCICNGRTPTTQPEETTDEEDARAPVRRGRPPGRGRKRS